MPITGGAPQPVVVWAKMRSTRPSARIGAYSRLAVDLRHLATPARRDADLADGREFPSRHQERGVLSDGEAFVRVGPRGYSSVWLSNADGSRPVELTSSMTYSGTPRWSPDGRRSCRRTRGRELGSLRSSVLKEERPEVDAGILGGRDRTWSRDGRWIYFHSDRTGRPEIWKIPSDGGTAEQVTRAGGFYAAESGDGRYLYYAKSSTSGIWRVPLAGGDESEIVADAVAWQDWAIGRQGLYYAKTRYRVPHRRSELAIQYLDFSSDRTTTLFRKEGAAAYLT